MKKLIIGASVTVLLLVLFASAFAFSASLKTLHLNAASFSPATNATFASPMTYDAETQITSPQADEVRFQTIDQQEGLCQRDQVQSSAIGF